MKHVYLRVSAQSTTILMCTHQNLAVLCPSEPFTCLFIVLSKYLTSLMMQHNDIISKDGVMMVFPTKCAKYNDFMGNRDVSIPAIPYTHLCDLCINVTRLILLTLFLVILLYMLYIASFRSISSTYMSIDLFIILNCTYAFYSLYGSVSSTYIDTFIFS